MTTTTGTGKDERKINYFRSIVRQLAQLLRQVRGHETGRAYARAGVVSYMGLRRISPEPKSRLPCNQSPT